MQCAAVWQPYLDCDGYLQPGTHSNSVASRRWQIDHRQTGSVLFMTGHFCGSTGSSGVNGGCA